MAATMSPWPEATTIDTESGGFSGREERLDAFSDLVQQVLGAARPHGPEHIWRPARPVMLPG